MGSALKTCVYKALDDGCPMCKNGTLFSLAHVKFYQ